MSMLSLKLPVIPNLFRDPLFGASGAIRLQRDPSARRGNSAADVESRRLDLGWRPNGSRNKFGMTNEGTWPKPLDGTLGRDPKGDTSPCPRRQHHETIFVYIPDTCRSNRYSRKETPPA